MYITNHEKKKMKPLTNKEIELLINQKNFRTCGEEFVDNNDVNDNNNNNNDNNINNNI